MYCLLSIMRNLEMIKIYRILYTYWYSILYILCILTFYTDMIKIYQIDTRNRISYISVQISVLFDFSLNDDMKYHTKLYHIIDRCICLKKCHFIINKNNIRFQLKKLFWPWNLCCYLHLFRLSTKKISMLTIAFFYIKLIFISIL